MSLPNTFIFYKLINIYSFLHIRKYLNTSTRFIKSRYYFTLHNR